eukprot:6204250-Pleurochrysis_carterae.AAC.5
MHAFQGNSADCNWAVLRAERLVVARSRGGKNVVQLDLKANGEFLRVFVNAAKVDSECAFKTAAKQQLLSAMQSSKEEEQPGIIEAGGKTGDSALDVASSLVLGMRSDELNAWFDGREFQYYDMDNERVVGQTPLPAGLYLDFDEGSMGSSKDRESFRAARQAEQLNRKQRQLNAPPLRMDDDEAD